MNKKLKAICVVCGDPIPVGRLKVLPNAQTCVKHTKPKPVTAQTDGIVDGSSLEDMVKITTVGYGG